MPISSPRFSIVSRLSRSAPGRRGPRKARIRRNRAGVLCLDRLPNSSSGERLRRSSPPVGGRHPRASHRRSGDGEWGVSRRRAGIFAGR
jgi:hypothetical protein